MSEDRDASSPRSLAPADDTDHEKDVRPRLRRKARPVTRKYLNITVGAICGLVCLQFVTYYTLSERFLVRLAMRCRPELTHYSGAPEFRWVWLVYVNTGKVLPEVAQQIKDAFEARYDRVYYAERDIPEELKVYHTSKGKRRMVGYKGGYRFSIALRRSGFMNIIVSHRDFESGRAAYNRRAWRSVPPKARRFLGGKVCGEPCRHFSWRLVVER